MLPAGIALAEGLFAACTNEMNIERVSDFISGQQADNRLTRPQNGKIKAAVMEKTNPSPRLFWLLLSGSN